MAREKTKKKKAERATEKRTAKAARTKPPEKKSRAAEKKTPSAPKSSKRQTKKEVGGTKKTNRQSKIEPVTARQGIARKTPAKTPKKKTSPAVAAKTSEEARKVALRKLLVQKREEIVREVKSEISKYIKGETRQLVDTALDDGDWSVVDLSEDISFKHMSTHRETLVKIDEALRKLNEGTYGICEDCGEEISEQRLKILPFAIYCTDCQERWEQLEELEKREGLIG